MRTRQIVTPVLWLLVVLAVGFIDCLRCALRVLAVLRPKGVLALVVLTVLWRSSDLLAAQFPLDAVRPLGYGIGIWGVLAGAVLVVGCGLGSRLRRRLWSRLARRLRLAW